MLVAKLVDNNVEAVVVVAVAGTSAATGFVGGHAQRPAGPSVASRTHVAAIVGTLRNASAAIAAAFDDAQPVQLGVAVHAALVRSALGAPAGPFPDVIDAYQLTTGLARGARQVFIAQTVAAAIHPGKTAQFNGATAIAIGFLDAPARPFAAKRIVFAVAVAEAFDALPPARRAFLRRRAFTVFGTHASVGRTAQHKKSDQSQKNLRDLTHGSSPL